MERLWLKSYPENTEKNFSKPIYKSLSDMFLESTGKYADKIAFECSGAKLHYSEVENHARNLAAYFQKELKLEKGDRLGLMTVNGFAFPIVVIAAQMCGLTLANINPLYTSRELEHQLKDAGVTTLVIYSPIVGTYYSIADNVRVKNVILTDVDDFIESAAKEPKPAEDATWLMDALLIGNELEYEAVDTDLSDIAFLQYTGGTTGPSKGAMLSHANILSNLSQCQSFWEARLDEGDEVVVTAIPLYHIFALTINFLLFFKLGGKNILIPNPRDIKAFVQALSNKQFTAFTGVNTLFAGLPEVPEFRQLDFSRFDFCVGGGAAIIETVANRWNEVTGAAICQAYGLSETSPALTSNPIDASEFKTGVGMPVPGTDIKLLDDSGREVATGEAGELCAKGPQVMLGYWGREEATRESMTEDGYFKTGDIAVMDEDGYFQIVDRKKDMVIVSGFNVYPNELEAIITSHPSVLEVACIGVPDEKTGEAIKAFVVVKENQQLEIEQLRDFCRANLTAYKVPKHIEVVKELPKSTVGKILRRELRDQELNKN